MFASSSVCWIGMSFLAKSVVVLFLVCKRLGTEGLSLQKVSYAGHTTFILFHPFILSMSCCCAIG